jgi:hypothetical protein
MTPAFRAAWDLFAYDRWGVDLQQLRSSWPMVWERFQQDCRRTLEHALAQVEQEIKRREQAIEQRLKTEDIEP